MTMPQERLPGPSGNMIGPMLYDAARALVSLAIIAAGVVIFMLLGQTERPKREREKPVMIVETMSAKSQTGNFEFDVDGVVVPFREVDVAAEVSGRVTYKSLNCRAGQPVREGDLLFRIDDEDYRLDVARLKEVVEQAQASLEELGVEEQNARDQIQLAEEELKIRQRELSRYVNAADTSVFSRAEIDVAKRNELIARNSLESRKDALDLVSVRKRRLISAEKSAQTSLRRAELELERCEVRSRVTGVIVSENVQQEGFVQKGGVLMKIRDTAKMEVRCNLLMRQLQWLWESQRGGDVAESDMVPTRTQEGYRFPRTPANVIFEINDVPYQWSGVLARYADSGVDQRTRMIPCIVEVEHPEKATKLSDGSRSVAAPPTLLSGMFVNVRITASLSRPLLKLPVASVAPGGDVWYVDNQNLLRREKAKILHAGAEEVLVERTPKLADSQIVTSPLVSPVDGMPASIVNSQAEAEDSVTPVVAKQPSPIEEAE